MYVFVSEKCVLFFKKSEVIFTKWCFIFVLFFDKSDYDQNILFWKCYFFKGNASEGFGWNLADAEPHHIKGCVYYVRAIANPRHFNVSSRYGPSL